MKILVDTNILISAILFPYTKVAQTKKRSLDMFPPTDSVKNVVDMFPRIGKYK